MYPRSLTKNIQSWLEKREILILYGARQVGKTTLLKMLFKYVENSQILNCEIPAVSDTLESKNLYAIKTLFGNKRIIGLDEAQKITNIGSILKLIYDEMPEYKIIATGSSSFDLANRIIEPLTGRNIKFRLYPLSLKEIEEKNNWLWILNNLNNLLVYGTYPGIIDLDVQDKQVKLSELSGDYLYKDILVYEQVKNPTIIRKLLKALALQVGSQVSVNELSNLLGITRQTVKKYLDLLEKSFVIFPLESFSSNLRNEIKKSWKYYFYDNGIMNALSGNFTPVENRLDTGTLWENFCISERIKINSYSKRLINTYFWRTYDGAEIDLVEEKDGKLNALEFKWKQKRKITIPSSFSEKYGVKEMKVITPETLYELINN
ncbi:MAG: ATP-binding protein [Bacteroidales bacterium]|nr:ATP-binding protein [Bacteroidales bacterium]